MFEDGPRRGKALGERVCSEHFTCLVGILRHSPDLDIAKDPARYSRKVVEVILTRVQESKT